MTGVSSSVRIPDTMQFHADHAKVTFGSTIWHITCELTLNYLTEINGDGFVCATTEGPNAVAVVSIEPPPSDVLAAWSVR